jgi:hypothetical protein
MQQHSSHFWTHFVVLCSLEQQGGAWEIMPSNFFNKVWHFLDLW